MDVRQNVLDSHAEDHLQSVHPQTETQNISNCNQPTDNELEHTHTANAKDHSTSVRPLGYTHEGPHKVRPSASP